MIPGAGVAFIWVVWAVWTVAGGVVAVLPVFAAPAAEVLVGNSVGNVLAGSAVEVPQVEVFAGGPDGGVGEVSASGEVSALGEVGGTVPATPSTEVEIVADSNADSIADAPQVITKNAPLHQEETNVPPKEPNQQPQPPIAQIAQIAQPQPPIARATGCEGSKWTELKKVLEISEGYGDYRENMSLEFHQFFDGFDWYRRNYQECVQGFLSLLLYLGGLL